MTIAHETLIFARGIAIRRRFNDGRLPEILYWGGREFGWHVFDNCKLYGSKAAARIALGRILRHERELGLANRINRRY
jgi:hypothetical protein